MAAMGESGTGGGDGERIDRWLWAVRLFKTRSLAATECRSSRIRLNGAVAKASRTVRPGDRVELKREGATLCYEVIGAPGKRVGAKVLDQYLRDVTPAEEVEKARAAREAARANNVFHDLPSGRPTKRDRRRWESFLRGSVPKNP